MLFFVCFFNALKTNKQTNKQTNKKNNNPAQFNAARISVFNNYFSTIYDFTPKEGNYSFLPEVNDSNQGKRQETEFTSANKFPKKKPAQSPFDLVRPLSQAGAKFVNQETESDPEFMQSIVPLSFGNRPGISGKKSLVIFYPGHSIQALAFLSNARRQAAGSPAYSHIRLVRTKEVELCSNEIERLLQQSDKERAKGLRSAAASGPIVALSFGFISGDEETCSWSGVSNFISSALSESIPAGNPQSQANFFYLPESPSEANAMMDFIFEQQELKI